MDYKDAIQGPRWTFQAHENGLLIEVEGHQMVIAAACLDELGYTQKECVPRQEPLYITPIGSFSE